MLRLAAVSRDFGGVRALSEVSLEVRQGEVFGLIGPNGAGKTTLFNVVTGIHPVTTGGVWFEDRDLTNRPPSDMARAGIARTFQSVYLFSGMSVLENVIMGQSPFAFSGLRSLVPFAADRREARLAHDARARLDQLGLGELAGFPARQLPYALQRKVEIARALASRPKLLLLDEPAAGFDEQESRQLAADIRAIRDQGITTVLIEHDMSVVMDVCDRIAVLDFGQKIAEGTPAEVRENPQVIEAYLGRDDEAAGAAARREAVG